MAYLRLYDYYKQIQAENLAQVISSDDTLRLLTEQTAMEEAESYLSKKYDTTLEFADILTFSMAVAYVPGQLLELNGPAWSGLTTYAINAIVVKSSVVYYAKLSGTNKDPETQPTYWGAIGNQYDLFCVQAPQSFFNYAGTYAKNDQIFWKGKTYTCQIGTLDISHQEALQYRLYENMPPRNVLPDDPIYGLRYWGAGTAYAIAAGTLPTSGTFYVKTDGRSQIIVTFLVDIVLYHLHSRISPRNIPELRMIRYEAAIKWLQMVAAGKISVNLPLIQSVNPQTTSGIRIKSGGQVKNINTY